MQLCEYFGRCGGCTTQHVPYELQLSNKLKFVEGLFKKAEIELPHIEVMSGQQFHYRNRMDFVFSKAGPGLRKRGKFDRIVPIKACKIAHERINILLNEVWEWFENSKEKLEPFLIKAAQGTLKYAVIRVTLTGDSSISFILNEESSKLNTHVEQIKQFSLQTSAENVIVGYVPRRSDVSFSKECFAVKGGLILTEELLGRKIRFHSQAFFQTNCFLARKLVEKVRTLFSKHSTEEGILIDLYGGAGSFGITSGDLFSKTIIIDNSEENIRCAEENLKINNIQGEAISADASFLRKLKLAAPVFMIVDPPRSGINPKVIKYILGLLPKVIIYVSCNPKEFVKDLHYFLEHYTLESLTLLDMFPNTNHIELVAELKKR